MLILSYLSKTRFTLVCLLILCLSGCMTQPTVDAYVTAITPMPSTLLEQRAEINLRLKNLSESNLVAEGIDVRLIVNGKQLARGVKAVDIQIDPLSETLASVEVSTRAIDVFRQVVGIQSRQTYSYQLKGRLIMAGLDQHFDHGGEISRAQLLNMFQPQ